MNPIVIAAAQAVIQELLQIISQVSAGKITDQQAADILNQSAQAYKAARANWDSA